MKTSLIAAAFLFVTAVEAETTVSVFEFGSGGVVRRSSAKDSRTTVAGVASFWGALHAPRRKLQHAGMSVVPDLFNRADGGLVMSLTGVDMAAMPSLSSFVESESVGQMRLQGQHGRALCHKVGPTKSSDASSMVIDAKSEIQGNELKALTVKVGEANAGAIDAQIDSLVKALEKLSKDSNKNLILHLVVEEDEDVARRRLEDMEDEDEDEEDDKDEEEKEEEDDEGNGNKNGYYGYGYYNSNGVWVTPYKTMFQIQYFNVVLWTSVGLVVVLLYSIYMTIGMPLEADTLLFGESAKMAGDS